MNKYFLAMMILIPITGFSESIKKSSLIDTGKIIQIFSFLIIILVMIVAISYITKKFRLTKHFVNRDVEISNIISLTAKDKLVVIKTKSDHILLGLSPGRISYLCHLDKIKHELHHDD